MARIENPKEYVGQDLEQIFFRPMLTGPDAEALGVRVMYNMPVPTTLHFWRKSGDVLQKYTSGGWSASGNTERKQKKLDLHRVKAETGHGAEDYFGLVYSTLTNASSVNMDDLTGTMLEEAETALFKEAIAESIRATMWVGNTKRGGSYNTFDGFIQRIKEDMDDPNIMTTNYSELTDPEDAETLFKLLWENASQVLRDSKQEGNLAFFVTSDVYAKYEDFLDNMSVSIESAYLARQNGRRSLSFRGIPVIDVQIGNYLTTCTDMPRSFALLTDKRNLVLAVNTADFPGTEVRMWYNPDVMENRQRAVFMAGCDYLMPELISFAEQAA